MARVEDHAAVRDEVGAQRLVEHLRRDDEAADGKHAALQAGQQVVRVHVRRDQDVGGRDRTTRREHLEAVLGRRPARERADRERACVFVEAGTRFARRREDPGVEPRRLQPARALEEDTTVERVGAELGAQLVAEQEPCGEPEAAGQLRGHGPQLRELLVVVRDEQRARAHVVAVDLAAGDLATLHLAGAGEAFDEVERVDRGVGELAAERAVAAGQLAGSELQLGEHHPAVAGARAGSERPGLERDDRAPARASCHAADAPQYPAPTTTTSATPGQLGFVGQCRAARHAGVPQRHLPVPGGERGGRDPVRAGGHARIVPSSRRTARWDSQLRAVDSQDSAIQTGRYCGFPCAAATTAAS